VTRDRKPDLRDLVLDLMDDIVELQKNIHLNDPVVIVGQFADLPVHMLDQLGIGVKMHTLDVDGHGWTFRFREINGTPSAYRTVTGSDKFNLRRKDPFRK
jgi:hypothetical protein